MLEVSQLLVERIQNKDSSVIQKIKIAYLIETTNYDPWFIGTEYCHLIIKKP